MCLRVLLVSHCVMVYDVVLFVLFVRVCFCVCVWCIVWCCMVCLLSFCLRACVYLVV